MEPWFGPKQRYDFGIARWQGGVAGLLFFAVICFLGHFFRPAELGWPEWSRQALMLSVLVSFGALVWAKYDRDPL